MIDNENIELYLFRYKEGLLDPADVAEVERALAAHPEWQELANLYDPELKLPAGVTIPYDDAELLRDGGPKAVRCRKIIPLWMVSAVAACLLFAVGVGVLHTMSETSMEGNQVFVAQQNDVDKEDSVPTPEKQSPLVGDTRVEHYVVAEQPRSETPDATSLQEEEMLTPLPTESEHLLVESDPTPVSQQEMGENFDSWMFDNEAESIYSNRLITYLDDISAEASLATPEYVEPANRRGDAVRQISDQVNDLAFKSSEFVANTRRRYQDREARILSDIEQQSENNSFIRNLIASIL